MGYFLRRLIQSLLILFGVSVVTFTILFALPADPARQVAGRTASPQQVEEVRHQLGLDLPLPALELRSLRRTFASLLYALGQSPADVMAQMGHTTPGLALRVYAQTMRLEDGERERAHERKARSIENIKTERAHPAERCCGQRNFACATLQLI